MRAEEESSHIEIPHCVEVLYFHLPDSDESAVLGAGVGLPLPVKFLISVLLIAPPGFLMGVPFPTGLRRLEEMHKPSVRWAWSLNAAASVLGSVAAIVLAIYLGLRETLLMGGAMYLCALATLTLSGRRAEQPRQALATPQAATAD